MITGRVRALFQFIDFLDSNQGIYKTYLPLVDELLKLIEKRNELSPHANYKDKRLHDEIQQLIKLKFDEIESGVTQPIFNELIRLGLWDGVDKIFFESLLNNTEAINELKKTFIDSDIKEIQEYKQKYLGFRTEVKSSFPSLKFMFHTLDEVLIPLFDYFRDTEASEFKAFQPIQVHSIREAAEYLVKGYNPELHKEIEFVTEITDYFGKKLNNAKSEKVIFVVSLIDEVLTKHNYKPREAIDLLIKHKGTFEPNFFENVVKKLIEKLDGMTQPIPEPEEKAVKLRCKGKMKTHLLTLRDRLPCTTTTEWIWG